MRFQGANHAVLKPKAPWILVCSDLRDFFTSADSQSQSALLNRLEMIAACNDAHVVPGSRQFNGEIAANRTSTKYAKFHARIVLHGHATCKGRDRKKRRCL